jgi:hypothetical protein
MHRAHPVALKTASAPFQSFSFDFDPKIRISPALSSHFDHLHPISRFLPPSLRPRASARKGKYHAEAQGRRGESGMGGELGITSFHPARGEKPARDVRIRSNSIHPATAIAIHLNGSRWLTRKSHHRHLVCGESACGSRQTRRRQTLFRRRLVEIGRPLFRPIRQRWKRVPR